MRRVDTYIYKFSQGYIWKFLSFRSVRGVRNDSNKTNKTPETDVEPDSVWLRPSTPVQVPFQFLHYSEEHPRWTSGSTHPTSVRWSSKDGVRTRRWTGLWTPERSTWCSQTVGPPRGPLSLAVIPYTTGRDWHDSSSQHTDNPTTVPIGPQVLTCAVDFPFVLDTYTVTVYDGTTSTHPTVIRKPGNCERQPLKGSESRSHRPHTKGTGNNEDRPLINFRKDTITISMSFRLMNDDSKYQDESSFIVLEYSLSNFVHLFNFLLLVMGNRVGCFYRW